METLRTRPEVTVVTPTRRLAHYLKSRHDADCAAQGYAVWATPDVVPWASLIERMHAQDRASGRNRARWLSDSAARLAWERVVRRDGPLAESIVNPAGLGRAAWRSWRLLHDYSVPVTALPGEASPEAAAFARWVAAYEAQQKDKGWIDGAQAQSLVDPRSAGRAMRFVGFDALTPAQAAFVERMRAAGVTVEIEQVAGPPGVVRRVAAQDALAEIEMAARWAARRLDTGSGGRIGIVVPGLGLIRDDVRRVLDRVLAPAATACGGPLPETSGYEIAAAQPLSRQPVVSAALEWLAAYCGKTDLAACSALLRNAFCGDARREAGARARLDARLRRRESAAFGISRLAAQAARNDCPALAALLERAATLATAWQRAALPSSWSQAFFDLLAACGWPGDDLDSAAHQARQRWQSLLAELATSDDLVGPVSAGLALGLLRESADATLFEVEEIQAPLLVIDPETCAGMHFDSLWVTGLDTTRWPASAAPDPFVPREWQVRRGLPGASAEIQLEVAQRTLARLQSAAPEVMLSWPQFEKEAPLLPSALLADIASADAVNLWDAPAPALAQFGQRPELDLQVDGSLPPLATGATVAGGARLMELQSRCPMRAAAEIRLGARLLETPALGLDAAARGNAVHDVLEALWRQVSGNVEMMELPAAERSTHVESAIANALLPLRKTADDVLQRLLDLEAVWLRERVLELLDSDLHRPSFTVESVEQELQLTVGGLSLNLRLDRVDRLDDGSLAVIDYKTGADAETRSWMGERPKFPQLPLYVQALAPRDVSAVAFGRVRSGETGYAGVARDPALFPPLGDVRKKAGDWATLLGEWRRRLDAIAGEYAAGDARLAPDPQQACRSCHLPAFCRIGETALAAESEEDADG